MQYSSKLLLEYWMQTFVFSLGAIPQCTTEPARLLLRCYVSWLVLDFYVIYFPCWTPCIHPSSLFLPFLLCLLLPFSLFPKSNFLLHWKMEARSDHSLAFSVRVFTLQEKVRAEACVDTHKEVIWQRCTLSPPIKCFACTGIGYCSCNSAWMLLLWKWKQTGCCCWERRISCV